MIDPNKIPEAMRRCMAPETRKSMGKAAMTLGDAEEKRARDEERKMHDLFEKWLMLNRIPYVHARMDQKSTIKPGWPDFTVMWKRRVLCIEFKVVGKPLSDEQGDVFVALAVAEVPARLCTDVAAAILASREILKL